MATINSNCLGLYTLDSNLTSPLEVVVTAETDVTAILDTAVGAAGVAVGEYFLAVNSAGGFVGIGVRSAAAALPTDGAGDLTLMALATSSNLETSNSITETAARNGACGSTNFIASGALSWNMTVDGLLDVAGGTGSVITIMDAARSKNYLIAKFEIVEGGTATTFYAGQTVIESASIAGGVDDIATYSANLSGYGDLYKGTTA